MKFPPLTQRTPTRGGFVWLAVLSLSFVAIFLPRITSSKLNRVQQLAPSATTVRQITLATKDLVYDPGTQRIYASVPSSAGGIGNSITQIDPIPGTVGASVPIGSEPGKLAISDNSQYIYASLDGDAAVRRFDLATQTAGLQFSLGSGPQGIFSAGDLSVMPGQADSIAISRRYPSTSSAGVAVYDNGVPRPTTTLTSSAVSVIEFSSTASTLYGYYNESTEFGFRKLSVDASGVSVVSSVSGPITGFSTDILYDNGLVYSTNGKAIEPETATQVGTFTGSGSGSVAVDSPGNRVYFLSGSGATTTLKAFDKTTFLQTGSLSIAGVSGTPDSLIKWGADGLAFRTSGNQVFLLSTTEIVPIVPTPIPSPTQLPSGVVRLPVVTSDLVYEPNSQKVYASLPSSAGSFGNSIAAINPTTGVMDTPVFLGSEPAKLAISDSSQYVYAGLDGSASIRRFDTIGQTAGLLFSLGNSQFSGPHYADDIAVMPGSPNSIAVSRRNQGFSPRHEGVAIYDDAVMRSVTTAGHTGADVIEFSSLASTLYGYNNETTEFGFYKLAVTGTGVAVAANTRNVINGFFVDIRYDNGLLYTTSGRVLNPETAQLVGVFADASGLVVPDSAAGRVYFLNGSSLKAYDSSTFLQTGAFTVPGVSGTPGAFIKSGANTLSFRTQTQVFFVPISAIAPIPPTPIPTPVEIAPGIIRLPLATNDLTYDPNTGKVYASVPGSAGSFGNSIAPIDPLTGTIGTPVFIGSDPGKLAISGNKQYIYAGLGIAAIRRFDLASQTSGLQFGLGNSGFNGPYYVDDMAVAPDNPNVVAVSRRNVGFSPRHEGVGIYDSGVVRSTVTPVHTGSNVIEFSSATATLYGYNNETSEFGFRKMAVSASGVSITSTTTGLINGSADIKYDNGRIYTSNGKIIDPEAGTVAGTFVGADSLAFVPDSTINRAFFVNGTGGSATLQAFNQSTLISTGFLNIPGVSGFPLTLIRWGTNGLALRTSDNQVFFIRTSLVPNAMNLIVNNQGDAVDTNVGDGICDSSTTPGDQCTLRAALQETNALVTHDTISFAANLSGGTITLNTALPDISGNLTITGPGASLLNVRRNSAPGTPDFRIFTVSANQTVTLSGLSVSNGNATGVAPASLGGGILNQGVMVVNNLIVSGNSSSDAGGGVANRGTLTINNSTIASNVSGGSGGGISNGGESHGNTLTVNNCTVSNNTSQTFGGGGIANIGQATISNSTISTNTGENGGGINNFNPMTVTNVTIANNSASNAGGGIYNPGIGTFTFANTIIAANTAPSGPDGSGANFISQDYNLIGNTSNAGIVGTTTHNITGVNALLGPLAANGGPTLTHALLVGSPAIDAGNTALVTDQRGQPRPIDDSTVANAAGGNASDIGAYEAHTFQVNSINDTTDGPCTAVGTGNGCTLREAITAANAEVGAEVITFAPALTAGGPATISLLTALPNLASDMTIAGPGAASLTVQRSTLGGTPEFRIYTINSGKTVGISGLTISNGLVTNTEVGGGIFVDGGTLNLTNSVVSGNSATNGGGILCELGAVTITGGTISGNTAEISGGGIHNVAGPLTITNSTISGNTCGLSGGGIHNVGGTGGPSSVATVTNSTVSGNTVTQDFSGAAGIHNGSGQNVLNLSNTTVTGNTSTANVGGSSGTGGIFNGAGGADASTVNINNSIVAGNTVTVSSGSSPDLNGAFTSQGYNLVGVSNGSNGFTNGVNGDQVGTQATPLNPRLGALGNNGGATFTHALLQNSPAIDAGNSLLTTDQRGMLRPVDSVGVPNAAGGNSSDIGAFESQTFQVNSLADTTDGACTAVGTGNGCTLREAIALTSSQTGAAEITFASALTAGGPATITLITVLPDLSSSVTIAGPGANLLTIERSHAGVADFRIFKINAGTSVTISGLTIGNGRAGGAAPLNLGGDILNDHGTLKINNCVIKDAAVGGGVGNFSGNLSINDSVISGNSTGVFNSVPSSNPGANPATVTINNCTIAGNSGPAINNSITIGNNASPATIAINNSTISGNNIDSAGSGAAIRNGVGAGGTAVITVNNSTISGNTNLSGTGAIYNAAVFGNLNASTTARVIVNNGTIFGNSAGGASEAGGVSVIISSCPGCDCSVKLDNTILAGNFSNSGATASDFSGTADPASSFNLIGTGGSGGLANGVNNNQVGVANVALGPLANNGGPTFTHALLIGSPALDAGSNAILPVDILDVDGDGNTTEPIPFDQRGTSFVRIRDAADANTTQTVDIGAFEAQVSIEDIPAQTINEDTSLSIPFIVGDQASITSVSATSSDTTLVPNNPANISISGSGSTRTLQINPTANAFGTSTISVAVNGSNGQVMTDTFLLTVNSVNDAPSFTRGGDQTVAENAGAQTVNNWASNISAGPANEVGQSLTFGVVNNSNSALFAVAPAISATGTLTYTPAAGISGTALITLALMDNGGMANGGINTSATQTFNITVSEGGALQFSSATFSQAEDGGSATITVTRTGGTSGEARVDYATNNGTATAGSDYTSNSGTLVFADGVTSQTFSVAISNDTVDEPDETISLTLTNAAGSGSLGTPASALLTVNDNDPIPAISINDVSVTEGDSGTTSATFTVTLSNQSTQTITVNFATANDTATAGTDYQAGNGSVTFLPLETSKPLSVTVNGDVNFEANEMFFVNLSSPVNATIADNQGLATINNDDAQGGLISFSQANYSVGESGGSVTITVNRANDLSGPATVDYATSDSAPAGTPCATINNLASGRCDYTTALGALRFAVGESTKTFIVLISQDNYVEGPESLTLTLSNLTGGAVFATPATATLTIIDDASEPPANPINDAEVFVRQHYHDFLNREPDPSGLAFWTNQITECQQPGATCNAEVRRINVSAAFFLSIEFQETGYLVERLYKSAYGDATGTSNFGPTHQIPVPVVRFNEFLPDTQEIGRGVTVGAPGWELVLANNKAAFVAEFVQRARFRSKYVTSLSPSAFVDQLFMNAGVTPSAGDRQAAIDEFGGALSITDAAAQARALRRVAENSILNQQEKNKAFVLMQYFGYLRRDPNGPPDADYTGYDFWLSKLNEFNGNFVNAEMVKAFIVSGEYRQRFGP